MIAPSSEPKIAPRPPNRLVPPITTAVIESRLRVEPVLGLAAATLPIIIQAVIAKIKPAVIYTLIRTRFT